VRVRRSPALLLAALLVAGAAVAQVQAIYRFEVLKPEQISMAAGEHRDLEITARHWCPEDGIRDGTVEFILPHTPPGFRLSILNANWGPCTADNNMYAKTTLSIDVNDTARSGFGSPIAIGAVWRSANRFEDSEKDTALSVRILYVGAAKIEGPKEGLILPGQVATVRMNLSVDANGDTIVWLAHDAPIGWVVTGEAELDAPDKVGWTTYPWIVRVQAPAGANGDTPVSFTATPVDALTHEEYGTPAGHVWVARLPPGASRPKAEEPVAKADEGPAPVTVKPTGQDDEIPVWVYGVAIVVGSLGLLLWLRKK